MSYIVFGGYPAQISDDQGPTRLIEHNHASFSKFAGGERNKLVALVS